MAYAKSQARSLNHLIILIEKVILGLEIERGESEQKSYIDIKQFFKKTWPFMWDVQNTQAKKILVQDQFLCETFSSYSYLDLVRNPEVQEFAIECARAYASGNHGPRMLGGNTRILQECEASLSRFFNKERTITTSSGYLAAMSAVAALARKGDVIFADQYCHASLRSGFTLSGATIVFFKHNNFEDCEKKIKSYGKNVRKVMVIESVYSMDGNIGNLPKARALCNKYNITLICDEAHGLGTIGKTGRGLEEYYNMPGSIDVIVGTFSKSLASVGGFISGSDETIQFMEFFSQGNVFSAPCSAYHAGAALKCLEIITEKPEIVDTLHEKTLYFRNKVRNVQWDPSTPDEQKFMLYGVDDQPILPIVFHQDPTRVFKIATKLKENGFITGAVVAPACPLRTPRLRITCCSNITYESIDKFVELITKFSEEIPVTKILDELK